MINIRTDLALELHEMYSKKNNNSEIEGIKVEKENVDNEILITRVDIINEIGEKNLDRPIGNYVTIEVPNLGDNIKELNDKVTEVLSKEITALAKYNKEKEKNNILIVGLGNWNVTPDALGPKVIDKIAVTRHLKKYAKEYIEEDTKSVCAVAPGVLGITGIETTEIIKAIVDKIKPTLVIAIDALASRRMNRISSTIQISNAGIIPGSGVGNSRMGLNQETLGVPVLALGIPTVVDAITIANDAMDLVIEELNKCIDDESETFAILNNIKDGNKGEVTEKILKPFIGDLVVTPKEIDEIITNISCIVSDSINISIHGSKEEAEKYLS